MCKSGLPVVYVQYDRATTIHCMQMRHKFEVAGGKVLEKTMAQGVRIHPDGIALQLQADQHDVTGQLLIDCMGNFSPIVRQVCCPQLHT